MQLIKTKLCFSFLTYIITVDCIELLLATDVSYWYGELATFINTQPLNPLLNSLDQLFNLSVP